MAEPDTDAEIVARAIKARTTPGYWDAHRHADLLAEIATSALAAAGRLRTVEHGRRIRAAAIREAIGAVAAHGPISGARWTEELERFAQIVEQPEEDTDRG